MDNAIDLDALSKLTADDLKDIGATVVTDASCLMAGASTDISGIAS